MSLKFIPRKWSIVDANPKSFDVVVVAGGVMKCSPVEYATWEEATAAATEHNTTSPDLKTWAVDGSEDVFKLYEELADKA